MSKPLRIKFLSKTTPDELEALWSPLVPKSGFEDITFTFDPAEKSYDFLVIYEGLPIDPDTPKSQRIEPLQCPRENTLLITTEPSSIRIDGPCFMNQFGHVLTSKSKTLTKHPNHIHETPPLRWFYGRPMGGSGEYMSIDQLRDHAPIKTKDLSTVCSTKQMSHTVHSARLDFVMALRIRLSNLDVYGRGIRPISDKAEAMENYRYHIAIENHIQTGHWTEKLSDCFLAGCLPFYFGDPDYAKAFPADSVIPIDIFDLDGAEAIIRDAITSNAYESRKDAVLQAREITLTKFNTLEWTAKFAKRTHQSLNSKKGEIIFSRHAFRKNHPLKGMYDLSFRTIMRHHRSAKPFQATKLT